MVEPILDLIHSSKLSKDKLDNELPSSNELSYSFLVIGGRIQAITSKGKELDQSLQPKN